MNQNLHQSLSPVGCNTHTHTHTLCSHTRCCCFLPPSPLRAKVRHPGVSQAIERDFETMVWLAHVAGQLIPATRSLRLDDTLKQFAAPLHEQVGQRHTHGLALCTHLVRFMVART